MFKGRLWFVLGFVVLSLLLPNLVHAQDAPTVPVQPSVSLGAPQVDSGTSQQTITLEELKKLFGAHNVCGAPCGGRRTCYQACGEPAICYSGYCLYALAIK